MSHNRTSPDISPDLPGEVAHRVRELAARFGAEDADVARLLCDDHPVDAHALTVIDGSGAATTLTFGELREASSRFARALQDLGVGRGDRVASLMDKSPELVVLMLALWRLGAVYVPLFTAFAPQAIVLRLEGSGARVIVVDPAQRHKLVPGEDLTDDPERRIVLTGQGRPEHDGDLVLGDLVNAAST